MGDKDDFSAEDLALLKEEDTGADASAAAEDKTSESSKSSDKTEASEPAGDKTPPAAEAKKAATVLDDDSEEEPPAKEPEAKKPEAEAKKPAAKEEPGNWREDFTSRLLDRLKDKIPADKLEARKAAILKQLGRYKSEFDYLVAGFSAQERIRSGEFRSKLPADATEEDKAAWRQENGLPAKASDYEFPKVAGHKWTDADKPLIDDFKAMAHAEDMTQGQVNKAAEWYAKTIQRQNEEYYERLQQTDAEDAEQAKTQMRAELGAEYKPTIALLRRGLEDRDLLDEASANALLTGRFTDKDGVSRRILNLPGVRELLISSFRDTYGEGSFIRGDGRPNAQNDLEEADRILKEDPERYWREGWDQKAMTAIAEKENKGRRRAAA